jgi:putative hydrolase of the HAD superfamily
VTQEPVEALLFDMGGVLIEIDFDRVFQRWAGLAGVPFEQVKSRFEHGAAYEAHERGEIDAAQFFATQRAALGIDLTDGDFEDGWQRIFGAEIAPTVERLPRLKAGIPLALFSNTNRIHHEYWKRRYADALHPIERHFISCEMGLRKPEREAFEAVGATLGVPLGRILFFDDTMANVEGARVAGLQAVHVRSPEDVHVAVARWL